MYWLIGGLIGGLIGLLWHISSTLDCISAQLRPKPVATVGLVACPGCGKVALSNNHPCDGQYCDPKRLRAIAEEMEANQERADFAQKHPAVARALYANLKETP